MKRTGQGKKDYIVYKYDDYSQGWVAYSKPVTIGQAAWILQDKPHLQLKVERIA